MVQNQVRVWFVMGYEINCSKKVAVLDFYINFGLKTFPCRSEQVNVADVFGKMFSIKFRFLSPSFVLLSKLKTYELSFCIRQLQYRL